MKMRVIVAASLFALCGLAPAAGAEETRSPGLVASLSAVLQERQIEFVAARNPDEPNGYVAALLVPGTQLLVVSAPYSAPAAMDRKLAEGDHRGVYLALNAGRTHKGRFFVMDLKADGLFRVCEKGEPFDSTTYDGDEPVSFDGNFAAQRLSEEKYEQRFVQDEARYARLLQLLLASVTQTAPEPANVH